MERMKVRIMLSLAILSAAVALAGCSGSGSGGETPPPVTDASMNVTTLTGVVNAPGSVDGAGVGGGSALRIPAGGAVVGAVLYVTDANVHVIKAIDLITSSMTTFAGTVGVSGPAVTAPLSTALFNRPAGIVSQGTSTLYVADAGNGSIRAINLTDSIVTTLTASSGFVDLSGLALSPDGNSLYAADRGNGSVYKISISDGVVQQTITGPFQEDPLISFNRPYSLATGTDKIYVGEDSPVVAAIDVASGLVSVVAGSIGQSGYANGAAADARFNTVYGVYRDPAVNKLYVTDAANMTLQVIDLGTLTVSPVAGNNLGPGGSLDGIGARAMFSCPDAITGDGTYIYVMDTGDQTVKRVDPVTGRVKTIVGTPLANSTWNGTGPRAVLQRPEGIVSDGTGTYLFLTDRDLHTVRRVEAATGAVVTLAGLVNDPGLTNGAPAVSQFNGPSGIAYDAIDEVLYVADAGNNAIRALDLVADTVTTLVSGLNGPTGIVLSGGTLYFSDTGSNLVKSVPSGTTTILTMASSLTFSKPTGIATDGTRIFVADTGNHRIVSISSGTAVVLAGSGAFGFADGIGTAAQFDGPVGLALDGTNTYLYVVDSGNNAVRRVTVATGEVRSVAGGTACPGTAADGRGSAAEFCSPLGIAVHAGKVYVTDAGNHTIRTLQ